jgi:hypothetical protein
MVIVAGPFTVRAVTKGTAMSFELPKYPVAFPGTKTVVWAFAVAVATAMNNANTSAIFMILM